MAVSSSEAEAFALADLAVLVFVDHEAHLRNIGYLGLLIAGVLAAGSGDDVGRAATAARRQNGFSFTLPPVIMVLRQVPAVLHPGYDV